MMPLMSSFCFQLPSRVETTLHSLLCIPSCLWSVRASWSFLVLHEFDSFEEYWSVIFKECCSIRVFLVFFSQLDWGSGFFWKEDDRGKVPSWAHHLRRSTYPHSITGAANLDPPSVKVVLAGLLHSTASHSPFKLYSLEKSASERKEDLNSTCWSG
jgi:hypothetical protein